MDFDNPRMCEVFFDIYDALPRAGPGTAESTLRALALADPLPEGALVLDLGCGPGRQTLDLAAALPSAEIVAVDLHRPFLDLLDAEVRRRGLGHRVRTVHGDMSCLSIAEESVDLIWSEGAAYSIGFAKALEAWRPLLRPGGYLAVSEATWLRSARPDEIVAFWQQEYPDMLDVEGCLDLFPRAGYRVIGSFPLPEQAWWQDFYTPMLGRLDELGRRFNGDPVAEAVLDESRREIEVFRRYSAFSGYTFVVARKASGQERVRRKGRAMAREDE